MNRKVIRTGMAVALLGLVSPFAMASTITFDGEVIIQSAALGNNPIHLHFNIPIPTATRLNKIYTSFGSVTFTLESSND